MNYIGVQAQPSLRYFHIDHFNSDIYTAPENALGCVLEFNIARSAADGLSFHCRFDPTRIALNDVQLLLARYKNSLTDLDAAVPTQRHADGRADFVDTINTMPTLKEYNNGKG